MKKIISLILVFVMIISGCSVDSTTNNDQDTKLEYKNLNDEELLTYVEDSLYTGIINELNSSDYFVEGIEATYVSKEYISELSYNSKENIFFGYTVAELDDYFEDDKYVFTLGQDNTTVVKVMEIIDDNTYKKVMQDVAIGTGVILVCATVSVVSAANAPAISVIFAASATTGTTFALQSGAMSGIMATLVRGYQTNDFDQAMKAGALAASESFKWGAISGSITGGAKEALSLHKATKNGLKMNEVAKIQRESKWPIDAIENIHSVDEYMIYKNATLDPVTLPNGRKLLIKEIDWDFVDDLGRTNLERVRDCKLSPLDPTGKPYELHHIGQNADSPLALLTHSEHHDATNFKILHYKKDGKDISDSLWKKQKNETFMALIEMQLKGK